MTAPVRWRAATEADFDELLAVLNTSERYDREPEITPPDELAEHLASTDIVLDRDSVVGVSSSWAYTLYERLGFRPLYRTVTMLRRL